MLKKLKFYIEVIHCASCKTLIETEIKALAGVKNIIVDNITGESNIEFEEGEIQIGKIFKEIKSLNYNPVFHKSPDEQNQRKITDKYKNIFFILIFIIIFLTGYILIQKFGLFELLANLNNYQVSYWLIFIIGLLASFHCIGMCGGLVVAYSTLNLKKDNDGKRAKYVPHLLYNFGRLISYTMVGAVLGGFGSFFGINPNFTGSIIILAGIFMILLGLSLISNFGWLEKLKVKTPSFIARFLYSNKHINKPKGPFIIGLLNGFMPCGPLQAMQIYALSTGNIIDGALSMGIYALGTIPVMLMFGGFISMLSMSKIKKVIQISGAIVIILGLFTLNRGLASFGIGWQGLSASSPKTQTQALKSEKSKDVQVVNMELIYSGYSPNVLYVKKGIPVRWIINAKQMSGCTNEIILYTDKVIRKKLVKGENIIKFTPEKTGEIKFSCWMKMVWGKFIVTD
jgi:sulfite exporter TauE/SafE/copper chaperone CopZ